MAAKRRRLDMESLALEESVQKRIAASYLINFREYSPAEAAAATGYTRASDAALWAKRLRSACTPYKQWGKRRGPAPIMTEQDADALGDALYDDPMGTGVGRVASTLNMPDVSTSTLYRGLIAHDWRVQPPVADLGLENDAPRRQIRLEFCKRAARRSLHVKGTFSDSKYFGGGGSFVPNPYGKKWARDGKPRCIDLRKAAFKQHVYAAITPYGASDIYFATGTTGIAHGYLKERNVKKSALKAAAQALGLDVSGTKASIMERLLQHAGGDPDNPSLVAHLGSRPIRPGVGNEEYVDILLGHGPYSGQKGLLRDCQDRFAGTRYADSWWWQQDGASVHTQGHTARGEATAEAIKSVAPNQTTDWPSRSPDLSLIESTWAYAERLLWTDYRDQWTDAASMREALKKLWRERITPEYCKNLFGSWEARRLGCIEVHGGKVKGR